MKITEIGYIKLHRSILSNTLWNEDRPRTKAEAWLELLMAAWYSDEPAKVMVGNRTLIYYRGEVYASLRYLADSWQWSKNKVDGFLAFLQNDGMITKRTDKGTGRTIVTICKYDEYNPKNEIKGQPTGHEKDSFGTASGQLWDTSGTNKKKDKEGKKSEKGKEGGNGRSPGPNPSYDCLKEVHFSENFFKIWEKLLQMPKWKKKPKTAVEMSFKKLSRYEEAFSTMLVENAISGNYQGVVFGDTDAKYQDYLNKKNGTTKNSRQSAEDKRQSVKNLSDRSEEFLRQVGAEIFD